MWGREGGWDCEGEELGERVEDGRAIILAGTEG